MRINFTAEQAIYLMEKTGADTPEEAVEIFAKIIETERVDPNRIMEYLERLMRKDGY